MVLRLQSELSDVKHVARDVNSKAASVVERMRSHMVMLNTATHEVRAELKIKDTAIRKLQVQVEAAEKKLAEMNYREQGMCSKQPFVELLCGSAVHNVMQQSASGRLMPLLRTCALGTPGSHVEFGRHCRCRRQVEASLEFYAGQGWA